MADGSVVSVVVTAKGETRERLSRLLHAIAAQNAGRPIEVVLAMPPGEQFSADAIGPIVAVRVVENPTGERSPGLNVAIRAASGELVCRLDARSIPPEDYVRRCVERLESDPSIGMVGGVQHPEPGGPGVVARGVARALANPWALGGAAYRRSAAGGPVDTVYLGAFRRAEVLDLGGYDERLDANEDFDLAQRYREGGALIWLEPRLLVGYEARTTIGAVWRQYLAFGRSKVVFWRLTRRRPNGRQAVAMAAACAAAVMAVILFRYPRRLGLAVAAAAVGAIAIDHAGDPRERSPAVRAASMATNAAVIAGWLAGIGVEGVVSRRRVVKPS